MIGYLRGKIVQKQDRSVLMDVSGVGYKVFVTTDLLKTLAVEKEISLFIHTAVREDDISLYGFDAAEALKFFELLLTVNRVGPRLALEIMNISVPKAKSAIIKKQTAVLASVSGVGRKTAERVVLELHDKLAADSLKDALEDTMESGTYEDVTQALIKLGYDRRHIANTLRNLPENIQKEEDIIKYFLQHA